MNKRYTSVSNMMRDMGYTDMAARAELAAKIRSEAILAAATHLVIHWRETGKELNEFELALSKAWDGSWHEEDEG